jgi:hypothetical protein
VFASLQVGAVSKVRAFLIVIQAAVGLLLPLGQRRMVVLLKEDVLAFTEFRQFRHEVPL